jgi:SH3 domain-containing YSC84-like protein 1
MSTKEVSESLSEHVVVTTSAAAVVVVANDDTLLTQMQTQQLQPTIAVLPSSIVLTSGNDNMIQNVKDTRSSVAPISLVDTSNDAAIAAALAAADDDEIRRDFAATNGMSNLRPSSTATTTTTTTTNSHQNNSNHYYTVATASAPWQYDDLHPICYTCHEHFHPLLNRKHHCRYCGNVFCHNCTSKKALIPPSRIVLHPVTGKKTKPPDHRGPEDVVIRNVSFTPNPDPDRMLTYIAPSHSTGGDVVDNMGMTAGNRNSINNNNGGGGEQLLYGRGLEERFQLAREPLRVCHACYVALQPVQEELRYHNSHAMRYNYIDPTNPQRLFNSPFANTLGHEIRKAAYALNNLLPQPKRRMGALVVEHNYDNHQIQSDIQQCKDTCSSLSPNLGDLDGVHIPAKLLEQAKGVAVLTVIKGGFGLAGVEFGTGLVVARLPNLDSSTPIGTVVDGGAAAAAAAASSAPAVAATTTDTHPNNFRWSAPSAIGTAGLSWGALIGAQVSDHVFLLMTDAAVALLYSNTASVQLGADIGIAVGPVGRTLEGDWGVDGRHSAAPIYTYSLSKGLYAGVSLDGKVIVTRPDVNEKFYGMAVSAEEILAGAVPTPPAAQPLYEALHRCHVYSSMAANRSTSTNVPAQPRGSIVDNVSNYSQTPTNFPSHIPPTWNVMPTSILAVPTTNEATYVQEYGEMLPLNDPLLSSQSVPVSHLIRNEPTSMGALSDVTNDF